MSTKICIESTRSDNITKDMIIHSSNANYNILEFVEYNPLLKTTIYKVDNVYGKFAKSKRSLNNHLYRCVEYAINYYLEEFENLIITKKNNNERSFHYKPENYSYTFIIVYDDSNDCSIIKIDYKKILNLELKTKIIDDVLLFKYKLTKDCFEPNRFLDLLCYKAEKANYKLDSIVLDNTNSKKYIMKNGTTKKLYRYIVHFIYTN